MKNFWLFAISAAILGGGVPGTSQPVVAQEAVPKKATAEQRLDDLDRRQRDLENRWNTEKENADAKTKETPSLSLGEDGFSMKSADGNFKLRLGGIMQADGRFFIDDATKPGTDTFLLRRARAVFEGAVFRYFDYKILPDFGEGNTILQDAYMGVAYLPEAKLRVGKFRSPFGLERLQQEIHLPFVERAAPTNLVPNRDVGAQLHGAFGDGLFSYAVGVFNGVPDGERVDQDINDSKDFAGRVFAHPFIHSGVKPLEGLGVGLAGTYGKEEGSVAATALPSFKTSGRQTFFSYRSDGSTAGTAVADGTRARISPQAYYYWGPFGMLGEYIRSSQEVRKSAATANLENKAWQIAAYYVLTGESVSYTGVKPKRPFDPRRGGWGAFALTGRYHELEVDKNAFPVYADPAKSAERSRSWTAGLNWHLNDNFKVVVNYEKTHFKGGETSGDREDENVVLSRFQIVF